MGYQNMIPLDEKANKNISDRYQKKTYTKGETCIYGNTLYRAKADITTAEEWNVDHWEDTNLETIRAEMAAEISSLNANKLSFDVFSEKYTSYSSSDRTVQIPKSNFKRIKSTNSIIGVYAYTNLQYDVKASWGGDYVYLLIKQTSGSVDVPVNIIVFFS